MAKKKPSPGQRTFESLTPATKIPDGYYSGDKPNPNLRRFVEEHATPYDPADDDYNVRAFNKPIETTKATAIYNMHVYWSKKPHTAIRQYIRHYTQPGDIVLDYLCGRPHKGSSVAFELMWRPARFLDLQPGSAEPVGRHFDYVRLQMQPMRGALDACGS